MNNLFRRSNLLFSTAIMASTAVSMATEIAPYQAKEIVPYKAKEIAPYKAKEIAPYKAKVVQPDQAKENKPYVAKDLSEKNALAADDGKAPAVRDRETPTGGSASAASGNAARLIGVYSTNVGGAAYVTPGSTPGYGVLHTSAGAQSGALTLRRDHTYTWNAYGGKQGHWEETGRADYPIVLDDKAEQRRWLVGPQRSAADRITIWDGNAFNYVGQRVK